MRNSLCRLTVQHDRSDTFDTVDLALPRGISLCQLMPAVVEIAQGATVPGGHWRLVRVGGEPLDELKTLAENQIDDGATLLLTTAAPPEPVWVLDDPSHRAAQLAGTEAAPTLLPAAGCAIASGIAAAALVWSATVAPTTGQLVTATGVAIVSAGAAVLADRARADGSLSGMLGVVAVMFATAAGFIAVPAGPAAADILLASAAAFSVSMVLLRLTRCGTACLTAIATMAMVTAAVAGVAVGWRLQADAVGASLAAVSLAALAVAPRICIMTIGIDRVTQAHRVLTGLVVGSATAAALGSTVVAVESLTGHASRAGAATFTAVIGVVLLLRTRTHARAARRTALSACGIVSVTASFTVAVTALPHHAHWISLLGTAVGVAALSPLIGWTVGPVTQRAVEVAEYLTVAAVIPLSCWVAGVYGVVRGMGFV